MDPNDTVLPIRTPFKKKTSVPLTMSEEHESFQPWQIFCGLFVSFWVTSAYFDHFMMTAVLLSCFGIVAEIFTKEMYGGSSNKKSGQKTRMENNQLKPKWQIMRNWQIMRDLVEARGQFGD
eukprot:TRINITY_DN0_c643_g1_i1.p1 TRINITY_DN0_c643_g1~~TRINITY_DN0_c643_g1_i1.p1  ORF type:complete len:121 (+),score=24.81 TRINITY_DN0_c643_g1_i1:30-392(+)